MPRTPTAVSQSQIEAFFKGAFAGGAKSATLEAALLNGTQVKFTAHSDPVEMNRAEPNEWDAVTANGAT